MARLHYMINWLINSNLRRMSNSRSMDKSGKLLLMNKYFTNTCEGET